MEYWARQDLEKLADTILLDCFKDDYEKAHTPIVLQLYLFHGTSAISYGSFFSLFHLPPGRTEKALCFIGCPIWPNTRSLRIFDVQKNQKFKGDYE